MLDDESLLSAKIIGTMILRDFCFHNLKYLERYDPFVHIERFNNMTIVQGLTQA